jgi:hypothetical protein
MHVIEGEHNLVNDEAGVILIELLTINYLVEQVATLDQFHHDPVAALIFQDLEGACDIRMVSLLQD